MSVWTVKRLGPKNENCIKYHKRGLEWSPDPLSQNHCVDLRTLERPPGHLPPYALKAIVLQVRIARPGECQSHDEYSQSPNHPLGGPALQRLFCGHHFFSCFGSPQREQLLVAGGCWGTLQSGLPWVWPGFLQWMQIRGSLGGDISCEGGLRLDWGLVGLGWDRR